VLPQFYGLADVFVFPTLGDTFGLVVDEAMACGLPVISTSAAGEIAYRIEEGVNGFIVPPADAEQLAAHMAILARNPGLRARMGEASEGRAAGQSPNRWARDFEDAIDRIPRHPLRVTPRR
jgi:glycosyltransferase involved in cell wall biosynthesis